MDTVLLIGNGGREHAILDCLVLSKSVKQVIVCNNTYWNKPFFNNPEYHKVKNYTLEDTSIASYIAFSKEHKVDLVVVGPEKYLAEGIVDECIKHDILCFGPTKTMAQIESSKSYGKNIMRQLNLPTADFEVHSNKLSAKEFLEDNIHNGYQVIKMDGLAGGKGVVVLNNHTKDSLHKGLDYIEAIYDDNSFAKVLIEKKVSGVEVSVLAFCNGKKAYLMPPARDFKRIYDGNTGPNTGGMGAICPGDLLNDHQLREIQSYMDSVVLNLGYKGVLYAGLMINHVKESKFSEFTFTLKPYFLEFNCRFGDPETQSILPLLNNSCDLYEIMCRCVRGQSLDGIISWKKDMKSINVVMSQIEYPYRKLDTPVSITFSEGLKRLILNDRHSFLRLNIGNVSYVERENGLDEYTTTGGRVLSIVVCGTDFTKCFNNVYSLCRRIIYKDAYYRMDIGKDFIIGANDDNRPSHWENYQLMNIPTVAIFQGEHDSINRISFLVKWWHKYCNTPLYGMIKIGLLVCNKKDLALMELSDLYNIPLLCIKDSSNITIDSRRQTIDVLRSFNIDMILSIDNFEGTYIDTKKLLFKEYGANMLNLNIDEHTFRTSVGKITRLLYTVRNYNRILPFIDNVIHTSQYMDVVPDNDLLSPTQYKNIQLANCFIEFLKIYNQRPLKYSVDIDGGNNFVDYLKKDNAEIGDFCFTCRLGSEDYGLATDGVGTKLDLAIKYDKLDDIGIDLVAMSVNDLYVHGIKPMYFLDYLAIDKMDINLCKRLVNSIKKGCKIANCHLAGGETAEMRGMYRSGKCDLGGFAVGRSVNNECQRIEYRRDTIEPGCMLYGLPSNGIHSNGFSLINDLVKQCYLNAELDGKYSLMSPSKIRKLLKPTRIYSEIPKMLTIPGLRDNILGIAHITGGGFSDNVHRVLCRSEYKNPDECHSPLTYELNFKLIDMFSYLSNYAKVHEIDGMYDVIMLYNWIKELTRCSMKDMFRTFNCGIGMVFVMKKGVDMEVFQKHGFNEFIPLGKVIEIPDVD